MINSASAPPLLGGGGSGTEGSSPLVTCLVPQQAALILNSFAKVTSLT